MSVLVCLARHAPGVVTKECLLEEVWSDSPYVGDDVISHAIWELRKALGDSARDPAYIQTVPRKGYRLIAEILRPQGSPLPMAGVRIDHYDLKEEIGRGAMGVVYEAVDRRLDRTVAIKFLAPDLTRDVGACRRFQREARLAASLDHPNLATVHEIGETSEGHRYIVSPYYRGGSLKDRLAEGPIEIAEALHLTRQLIAGLGAAHERDIVHRDVKPANLLLDEHGTLKICDFGIAKLLGATDLTRTGAPLGTPAYKSPEQTEGREIDHRTDLWSVGVVLFELVTSRRPFGGDYERAVAHSILSREPRILEDARGRPVPEALRGFIARALAKDPAERFQSAEEMTAALERLEGAPPIQLAGSQRWVTVAAGVVAVLLIAVLLSWQRGSPDGLARESRPAALGGQSDDPTVREARAHLAEGRRLWLRGHYPENLKEVRKHFKSAVKLLPDSADVLEHLAVFSAHEYSLNGREEDRLTASELAKGVLAKKPRSALARVAEARLLLRAENKGVPEVIRSENASNAEHLAREAILIEPECERGQLCDLAYVVLADALWVQKRFEDALEILTQGALQGDGRIRCQLVKAFSHYRLGELEKAEDAYQEVLKWDYAQTTALLELSTLLLSSERYRDAVPLLRLLFERTQDPKALNNLGVALYGLARYERVPWEDVISTFRRAHESFDAAGTVTPTPLVAIGDAYSEQGQDETARSWYLQALEKFGAMKGRGTRRQGERAVCLAKLGRVVEAEEEMERLLAEADDSSITLVHAARVFALKGDRDRLFELARRWQRAGQDSTRFLDDAAFIRYRHNLRYQRILDPQLKLGR